MASPRTPYAALSVILADGRQFLEPTEAVTTTKAFIPDYTAADLRDIMVYVNDEYTQTLTYGLSLLSVDTAVTAAEPTLNTLAAAARPHLNAHQSRLGTNAYFTDNSGNITGYNEFDAWGGALTKRPTDQNFVGSDVANGFTTYDYDGVLDLWFAQARFYDASNKRFTQRDPISGTILNPQTLNPYIYCLNSPQNYTDPTGKVPGDEKLGLTPEQQAAIDEYGKAWQAAQARGDEAGKAAAHAAADNIRAHAGQRATDSQIAANVGQPNSTVYNVEDYPPGVYEIMLGAAMATAPGILLPTLFKTYGDTPAFQQAVYNTFYPSQPEGYEPNPRNYTQNLTEPGTIEIDYGLDFAIAWILITCGAGVGVLLVEAVGGLAVVGAGTGGGLALAGAGGGTVVVGGAAAVDGVGAGIAGGVAGAMIASGLNGGGEKTPKPSVPYPGNDPNKPPGPDWEWRGSGDPASGNGNWINKSTGESLYPDLNHPDPIGPHWDYKSYRNGPEFRWNPDGSFSPK